MKEETIDTHSKALKINLDPRWYGTFAEIGAGQEVVRWFFRVGGATGTIAKSMSAYDMKVRTLSTDTRSVMSRAPHCGSRQQRSISFINAGTPASYT